MAGNYTVDVSVDDASPSPGGTVNFTIVTNRDDAYGVGYLNPSVVDLKVDIELTEGLSVSGTPTFAAGILGTSTVADSVSYSNGVFNIGTSNAGESVTNAVTLPITVASDAAVNEQCLAATLTGNPPPGNGPLDDDVSDNVAKLCLGARTPPYTSADLTEFISHPCVGISDPPCDNTDDVRVRALDATTGLALEEGTPLIHVPDDSTTRQYDGDAKSVNGADIASWQTVVQIGYEPYASEHERWGAITHNLAYEMVGKDGAFDKLNVRPGWGANDIFLTDTQRNADLFSFAPAASGNGPFQMTYGV